MLRIQRESSNVPGQRATTLNRLDSSSKRRGPLCSLPARQCHSKEPRLENLVASFQPPRRCPGTPTFGPARTRHAGASEVPTCLAKAASSAPGHAPRWNGMDGCVRLWALGAGAGGAQRLSGWMRSGSACAPELRLEPVMAPLSLVSDPPTRWQLLSEVGNGLALHDPEPLGALAQWPLSDWGRKRARHGGVAEPRRARITRS